MLAATKIEILGFDHKLSRVGKGIGGGIGLADLQANEQPQGHTHRPQTRRRSENVGVSVTSHWPGGFHGEEMALLSEYPHYSGDTDTFSEPSRNKFEGQDPAAAGQPRKGAEEYSSQIPDKWLSRHKARSGTFYETRFQCVR